MSTDLTILPTDEGGGDEEVTTLIGDAGRSYVELGEYPSVSVDVALDGSESGTPNEEAFRIVENDMERDVESVEFGRSAIDMVFVFDDTGSMSGEIAAMQRGVKQLTDAIDSQGIDARYGLVSFKNDPELDLRFTQSADELKHAVDELYAEGGGYYLEDNFGGIETALDMEFRADADPVIVDITDAPAHHRDGTPKEDIGRERLDEILDQIPDPVVDRRGEEIIDDFVGSSDYVMEEVVRDLDERDALFVGVAPDLDDPDKSIKTLASRVGGLWTNIDTHNFDLVLDRITNLVASTYSLAYVSTLEPGDEGELRVIYDPPRGSAAADEAFVSVPRDATRTTVDPGRTAETDASRGDRDTGGTSNGGTAIDPGRTADRSDPRGGTSDSSDGLSDSPSETVAHPGRGGADSDGDDDGPELPPFCPFCGSDLESYSGVSFCPSCGKSLKKYS